MNLPTMELQALQDIIDRKRADNKRDQAVARNYANQLSGLSGTAVVVGAVLVVVCLPAILSGSMLALGIGTGAMGIAGVLRGAASLIMRGTERKIAKRENEILDAVGRMQGLAAASASAPTLAAQTLPFDAAASKAVAPAASAPVAPAAKPPTA